MESIYQPAAILPLQSGCHKRQFAGGRVFPLSQWSFLFHLFLALPCANAHQSCCRGAGVRPSVRHPCVKPFFWETVKRINAKFCGRVPTPTYPDIFFYFAKFQHFYFLPFQLCVTLSAELLLQALCKRSSVVRRSLTQISRKPLHGSRPRPHVMESYLLPYLQITFSFFKIFNFQIVMIFFRYS